MYTVVVSKRPTPLKELRADGDGDDDSFFDALHNLFQNHRRRVLTTRSPFELQGDGRLDSTPNEEENEGNIHAQSRLRLKNAITTKNAEILRISACFNLVRQLEIETLANLN